MDLQNITVENVTVTSLVTGVEFTQSSSGRGMKLAFILGAVFLNITGLVIIVRCQQVKRTVKVLFLNLTMSDLMFILVTIFYAYSNWDRRFGSCHCAILSTLMAGTIPLSYATTLGLAAYSFLGTLKPVFVRETVTTRKVCLAAAVAWLAIFGTTFLINQFAPNSDRATGCIIIVSIPRALLVFISAFSMLCSTGILFCNMRVSAVIRSRRRRIACHACSTSVPGLVSTVPAKSRDNTVSRDISTPGSVCRSGPTFIKGESAPFHSQNTTVAVTVESAQNTALAVTAPSSATGGIISCGIAGRQPHGISALPSEVAGTEAEEDHVRLTTNIETVKPSCISQSQFQVELRGTKTADPRHFSSQRVEIRHRADDRSTLSAGSQSHRSADPASVVSTTTTQTHRHVGHTVPGHELSAPRHIHGSLTSAQIKAAVTLAILAGVNAVVTLPLVSVWLWLAVAVEDREGTKNSLIDNLLMTTVSVSCVCNPLLYAWRLLEWRNIYLKLKTMVTRCPRFGIDCRRQIT